MWPSFSLCACRILKIRSCLRSPLAPGRSSVRAIRVSSVMFFSFNSAMVMFTYGIFKKERNRSVARKFGGGFGAPDTALSDVARRGCRPQSGPAHAPHLLMLEKTPRCNGGVVRRELERSSIMQRDGAVRQLQIAI